ncbi:hypothetical protein GCM10010519_31570 [Streptomyces lactacystinicus]
MARIATRYGFASTAAEVAHDVDLTGRRALVTGASSGLGAQTARVLAGRGAAVTLAVRDLAAGQRVARTIALVPPRAVGSPGWSGKEKMSRGKAPRSPHMGLPFRNLSVIKRLPNGADGCCSVRLSLRAPRGAPVEEGP